LPELREEETIAEDGTESLKDADLIGAAQRVEHYEIAAYGTARTFAEKLGKQDVADLLQKTLEEEKEADEKLSEISERLLEGMTEAESQSEEEPSSGKRSSGKTAAATRTSRA
jgi:ferritin-like metal-binding protein YciE